MKIRVILFDLGSTLLYAKDPWQPFFEEAEQALLKNLSSQGINTVRWASNSQPAGFLTAYYADRGSGIIEKTAGAYLKETLADMGYQDVDEKILRQALDTMFQVTQGNWHLEKDALPVLDTLQHQGYRLGLISNTSDDKNVQQLIDRHNLRPYFETIVTSAACGIRKPDARIFKLALEHFKEAPAGVMMIGDTLEADVLGANQMGFYSVWINRRVDYPVEGELPIQPQAVISSLAEIPDLLIEIQKSPIS